MKNDSLKLTKIVCAVLVLTQTLIMIIPGSAFNLFNIAMQLRPGVYAALTAAILIFMGFDLRPVHKAYSANMISVLSVILFGITVLIVSILFGVGANVMMINISVPIRNLWEVGLVVVLGEFIRYKLIKATNHQNRTGVVIAVTIVLAYGHMTGVRTFFHGDLVFWDAFFQRMLLPIVVSAVASYFAMEGSFLSVILLSFIYTQATYFLPVLPDIQPTSWALISCALVFISAIIYRFVISDNRRAIRIRDKRAAKYTKRPILFNVITAAVIVAIIAFFMGEFPIYPVVILTDSMEGTLDRGSIAFVERVPQGEAAIMVDEGYVIHFLSRGRVDYIHRVVAFRHDAYGIREYITQGDASPIVDPVPVIGDDVLGIARASIRFLGWPYIFFRAVFDAFG
ncbi:MAG: S26 family signal peptidase [Defluviitaleaceae bacterium]|nr:S26 family signal peptidase [Defluviitaleaceae bacterium]